LALPQLDGNCRDNGGSVVDPLAMRSQTGQSQAFVFACLIAVEAAFDPVREG
jgi:endo-1,4-beta-D-glucanase Y